MKLTVFLVYLMMCFTIFSCSHNPYDNFQEIKIGDDKVDVLDQVGSPLRSNFQDGKNIWTYRFYSKSDDTLIYKDIVIDHDKVVEIRNGRDTDIKELEKKESSVEQSLHEPKAKPSNDDSTFRPVE